MEWFANMPLPWVIVIVIFLFLIRFILKPTPREERILPAGILSAVGGVRVALGRMMKEKWSTTIAETAESLGLAFALVFLIIRPFIVQAYFIPSESMEPTLLAATPSRSGDHLLANKAICRLRAPRHREIVVFKAPPALEAEEGKKDFIKRVIGTPGDTIEVRQGLVSINGTEYNHDQMRSELGDYDHRIKFFPNCLLVGDKKLSKKDLAERFYDSDAHIVIRPGVVIRNGKPLNEPYTNEDPDYDYPLVKVPRDNFFVMGDNRNNSKDSHWWGFLPRKYVQGKAMFVFWPVTRIGLIR
ncbi:MAG: signal peptidase I [Armatimonadota bacterium]|nr:signal peptidase I [Armatimonadota bacterium]